MSVKPKVTVICPVFNEEKTVPLFVPRISAVFESLKSKYEFDLLFVDNCSQDKTLDVVRELGSRYDNIFHIGLSRNFGYQRSVECGIRNAKGDLFVVIDVDCEDPPEMLVQFLAKYEEGYDIIYGQRVDRVEAEYLKFLRKIFYKLTRFVSDEDFILYMAEFCLMTAEVREAILLENNSFPFIRSSIGRVGFRRLGIAYKRESRIAGMSKYNLVRMSTFAIAGILSSSTLLLRFSAYSFPFWVLGMLGLLIGQLVTGNIVFGVTMAFLGFIYCGHALMSVSIYVARVYKNGLNRPNVFVVKRLTKLQPERFTAQPQPQRQALSI